MLHCTKGFNISVKNERKPLLRNTATATINAINVGKISTTVFKPSIAPSIKASYIFTFLRQANTTINNIVTGIIKSERYKKNTNYLHLRSNNFPTNTPTIVEKRVAMIPGPMISPGLAEPYCAL